jgi:polyisoprenoid-binding protein YceI
VTTAYRLDPTKSRFTVQAFATGMLSFMGHNPSFAVGRFGGSMRFDGGKVSGMRLRLMIEAESLALDSPGSAADRREIESRMRNEVLETATYAEIAYEGDGVASETVSPGRYRLRINGRLSLHGVTAVHPVEAELVVYDDGVRVRGESQLRLSEYRIRPVTALGGAIRLKDDLKGMFDIAGVPEAS